MTPTNSTQPGSVPYADFELTQESTKMRKDQIGPYGDGTEIPIFVQQPLEVHFYKFFCAKKIEKKTENSEFWYIVHSNGWYWYPYWNVSIRHGLGTVDFCLSRFRGLTPNGVETQTTDFNWT